MSDQTNNGRGYLKEKMGGYRMDPPESVWSAISSRMGRKSRRSLVIITLAAAASIALAITLGIHYFGSEVPAREDSSLAEEPDFPRESREETLEEKVVRTMEEIAEEAAEAGIAAETAEAGKIASLDDGEGISRPLEGTGPGSRQTEMAGERQAMEDGTRSETPDAIPEDLVSEPHQEEEEAPAADAGEELAEEVTADLENEPEGELSLESGEELQDLDTFSEEKRYPGDSRWNIGAAMSPLYSYRAAENGTMEGSPDHESGMISYSGGIQVGYRVSRRLALETGVFYNKMGITIGAPGIQKTYNEFDFAPLGAEAWGSEILAISNSVGNIVSESGDIYVNNYKLNAGNDGNQIDRTFTTEIYADEGIRQHLDYMEVPLNMRYALVDRNLKVNLIWGLSANFLVNNYVTTETAGETSEIGYLTNIRNVNYSGNAGIGLAYHFMNRFSVNLEPRFRYFMNSVNDDTLPVTRPYAFGLYTGLSYFF